MNRRAFLTTLRNVAAAVVLPFSRMGRHFDTLRRASRALDKMGGSAIEASVHLKAMGKLMASFSTPTAHLTESDNL